MESITDSSSSLMIKEQSICQLDQFEVEIQSKWGNFADIHYFQVLIRQNKSEEKDEGRLGLLRVGSVDGGLQRELELRQILGEHKMISELLTAIEIESVELSSTVSSSTTQLQNKDLVQDNGETKENEAESYREDTENIDLPAKLISWQSDKTAKAEELPSDTIEQTETELFTLEVDDVLNTDKFTKSEEAPSFYDGVSLTVSVSTENTEDNIEPESDLEYLEEEIYPDIEIGFESSTPKLILLSYLPDDEQTLETWLQQQRELEESLLLASQICQFCRYIYQQQWCVVNIFPQLIYMGKTVQFLDLTGAYPIRTKLHSGLQGEYCAPELTLGSEITEQMSTYTVGTILHRALYQKFPPRYDDINSTSEHLRFDLPKIPSIYQILTISLTSVPEERFSLSQLLNLLVKTRKSLQINQVDWEVASRSTVGLSTSRLQNEDSHGVIKSISSTSESLLLGVVADGMGGMAQGEIASQTAVKTILEAKLPQDLTPLNQRGKWLIKLVQQANEAVARKVKDGGTTISVVLAVGRALNIAHVGDSRIFLLRQGMICQLSEDHSLVAMLLASGQITYEESLDHPDRSRLIRSLGSKIRLSDGYVQDLSYFGKDFLLTLNNQDILILCSDGVWDFVSSDELAETFEQQRSLQSAINQTINLVLERGANDNATIVALKCCLTQPSF